MAKQVPLWVCLLCSLSLLTESRTNAQPLPADFERAITLETHDLQHPAGSTNVQIANQGGAADSSEVPARPPEREQAGATKDLAKEAQNPLANLISVPFQNNTTLNSGPQENLGLNVLNIQPVIPIRLNSEWLLVSRTIVPFVTTPTSGNSQQSGLGDINPQLYFVRSFGKLTLGAGPQFSLPTATDAALGSGKWSAGVTGAVIYTTGPWVVGGVINNLWSFAGAKDQPDVNSFLVQPFINYNLKGGWYLTSSPIITANWNAKKDRWTVPIGAGVGRLVRWGDQPINVQLGAYANALRTPGFGDVTIRAQVQFLFPR